MPLISLKESHRTMILRSMPHSLTAQLPIMGDLLEDRGQSTHL